MPKHFTLPQAQNNRNLNLTLDSKIDPYIIEYYEDTKEGNELLEEFIIRLVTIMATTHHAQKELKVLQDARESEVEIITSDLSTFLTELNLGAN